jgi:hypothetical protein
MYIYESEKVTLTLPAKIPIDLSVLCEALASYGTDDKYNDEFVLDTLEAAFPGAEILPLNYHTGEKRDVEGSSKDVEKFKRIAEETNDTKDADDVMNIVFNGITTLHYRVHFPIVEWSANKEDIRALMVSTMADVMMAVSKNPQALAIMNKDDIDESDKGALVSNASALIDDNMLKFNDAQTKPYKYGVVKTQVDKRKDALKLTTALAF